MKTLTFQTAKRLIGKRIKYSAPTAQENFPLFGEATIVAVLENEERPLVVENDTAKALKYAFRDKGELYLGDEFRHISYEVI